MAYSKIKEHIKCEIKERFIDRIFIFITKIRRMSKNKTLVSVKVIKGDVNRALKKYKRRVNDSGHLLELRERKTYTKPTTVRRKAKQQAIREQQKETILGKIADGDNTLRFYTKKKKTLPNRSEKKDNQEKTIENYGLKLNR